MAFTCERCGIALSGRNKLQPCGLCRESDRIDRGAARAAASEARRRERVTAQRMAAARRMGLPIPERDV